MFTACRRQTIPPNAPYTLSIFLNSLKIKPIRPRVKSTLQSRGKACPSLQTMRFGTQMADRQALQSVKPLWVESHAWIHHRSPLLPTTNISILLRNIKREPSATWISKIILMRIRDIARSVATQLTCLMYSKHRVCNSSRKQKLQV